MQPNSNRTVSVLPSSSRKRIPWTAIKPVTARKIKLIGFSHDLTTSLQIYRNHLGVLAAAGVIILGGIGRSRFARLMKWWLDNFPVVSTQATSRAVVGSGVTFGVPLRAGSHRFTVLTCRGRADEGQGFYLRQLPASE